jgi:rhodanese-related sulfurtransferase
MSEKGNGLGFDLAVEKVEWLAQVDLGAISGGLPKGLSGDVDGERGTGPVGHWTRYLRDAHPLRFRPPSAIDVREADAADGHSFGATAAFGLDLSTAVAGSLADLPGKPGWRCYIASGGKAPAAAATFRQGEIVLIAIDAHAEGRKSPSRAALLHRAIGDSIEAGAKLIGARIDEGGQGRREAVAGLLLAGFKEAYRCPAWVDGGLPAS